MLSFLSLTTLLIVAQVALTAPLLNNRQSTNCPAVALFFARGTTEIGTLGTVVGPGFQRSLQQKLGGQTLQFTGIDYPANVAGFLQGGDPQGAKSMADQVETIASSCSDTKIFVSGYSQGAQVAHRAAGLLSTATQARVNGAVVFGDPKNGQAFAGGIESKTFCATGDNICAGGTLILPAHLSYGANVGAAVDFVVSKV